MSVLRKIWEVLKTNKWARVTVCAVTLFLFGYIAGRHHKVPVKVEQHLVEDTVSKQQLTEELKIEMQLREQILQDQKVIADLKVSKTTHVHEVRKKDGTVIVDRTTKTDEEQHSVQESHTDKVAQQVTHGADRRSVHTDTTTHKESTTITTPQLRDDLYVGLFASPNTHGLTDLGVELKWSPFDHAWIGASLDTSLEFRLAVGFSFDIDG